MWTCFCCLSFNCAARSSTIVYKRHTHNHFNSQCAQLPQSAGQLPAKGCVVIIYRLDAPLTTLTEWHYNCLQHSKLKLMITTVHSKWIQSAWKICNNKINIIHGALVPLYQLLLHSRGWQLSYRPPANRYVMSSHPTVPSPPAPATIPNNALFLHKEDRYSFHTNKDRQKQSLCDVWDRWVLSHTRNRRISSCNSASLAAQHIYWHANGLLLANCLVNAQPLPAHRPATDDNYFIGCTRPWPHRWLVAAQCPFCWQLIPISVLVWVCSFTEPDLFDNNVLFDNTTPIYLINLPWKLGLGLGLDLKMHYFSIFHGE